MYVPVILMYIVIFFSDLYFFKKASGYSVNHLILIIFFCCFIIIGQWLDNYYIIIDPLFFLVMSLSLDHTRPLIDHLFYSFYACTINDLLSRILGLIIFPTLLNQPHEVLTTEPYYTVLVYLFVVPFSLFIARILHIDHTAIRVNGREINSKIYHKISFSMILFYTTVQLLTFIQYQFPTILRIPTYSQYLIIYIYIIIFVWSLNKLNYYAILKAEEKAQYERHIQFRNLANYNQYLAKLYEEVASFKDKTTQSLESLSQAIKNEDEQIIEDEFGKLLNDKQNPFKNQKYNLDRLINIKESSVKSLLSAKFFKAQEIGLRVNVEVPDIIDRIPIKILDFLIILSILLDNAIESAQSSTNKVIDFAIFKDEKNIIIVVQNSSVEESLNLKSIYDDGYSTKGEGRGLGLSNVSTILLSYPDTLLATKSSNFTVTQELTIPLN